MCGLIDNTEGRLAEAIAHAKRIGLWYGRRGLRRVLMYLALYGNRRGCQWDRKKPGHGTKCTLYRDFAPFSMGIKVEFFQPERNIRPMIGGLIYSGPGSPADGGFPSLTVSLSKYDGWTVNT